MTDQEKNEELLKLMDALCDADFSKKKDIDSWILSLKEIYTNEYRHEYSDIFFKLQQIITNSSDSETFEILGENLNVLGQRIESLVPKINEDVILGYKKFSDHIKLEIGRYNFIKSQFSIMEREETGQVSENVSEETLTRLDKIEKAVDDMRPTVVNAQKISEQASLQINGVDEKLENNKISSITTLTIFSAVILAFSGGITFEAGIFNGMANSSPYRLVFTIGFSGFILFNTIFALLYLVGKMAGKRISTRCKYLSFEKSEHRKRACGDGYCIKDCSEVTVACRMLHKYSYVFAINCVLLYIIYSDFFLWLSKGKISDIIFFYSQVVVLGTVFVIFVSSFICKKLRLGRIKLYYKVLILQEILEPQANDNMMSKVGMVLLQAFGATPNKSISDKFLEAVEGKNGEEAIEFLNEFLDEHLLEENRLAISVSNYENKINKQKFERLKNKFCELNSREI